MARWVQVEGKPGVYHDLDQTVSIEEMRRHDEEFYLWSCWLMSIRCPVVSYTVFCEVCEYMERHWDEYSERLRRLTISTRLTAAAPTIATILTRDEKIGAIRWRIRALEGYDNDSITSGDLQQTDTSPDVRALDSTD